ncbi:MAG: tetratricopeptide repeat protein [Planctomycetota bacterium]
MIEYCATRRIGLDQRLQLFADACAAVNHGHQRGVIHRDLKPANILVDEHGAVKLIDFGVAKLLEPDPDSTVVETRAGGLVGTLQYMSPEQMSGDGRDVDVRSDVYSLGLLLYELLSGRKPHDLAGKSFLHALDEVRATPPAPFEVVAPDVATDLRWITFKSISPDRQQRYGTVAELAKEIQRFRAGDPIEARPPTLGYRMRLFARRRRGVVAALAAITCALVGGSIVSVYYAIQAARAAESARVERIAAVEQRRVAEDTLRMFRDLLWGVLPETEADENIPVRELVDRVAAACESGEPLAKGVEGHLRYTVGRFYLGLRAFDEASRHLERASDLLRAAQPDSPELEVNALSSFAKAELHAGRLEHAATQAGRAVERARERLVPEDAAVLYARKIACEIAIYRGGLNEATEEAESLLALEIASHGDDTILSADLRYILAAAQMRLGEFSSAGENLELALETYTAVHGDAHARVADCLTGIAESLVQSAKFEDALEYCERARAMRNTMFGATHSLSLEATQQRAHILFQLGGYDQAFLAYDEVLELRTQSQGASHVDTLDTLLQYAALLLIMERTASAETLLDRAARAGGPMDIENSPERLRAGVLRGDCLVRSRKLDEAKRQYLETRRLLIARYSPDHPLVLQINSSLLPVYLDLGDVEAACVSGAEVVASTVNRYGEHHPSAHVAMLNYANALHDSKRHDAAEHEYARVIELMRQHQPSTTRIPIALGWYGRLLFERQRYAEAERALLEAEKGLWSHFPSDSPYCQGICRFLAELYDAWQKPELAAGYRARLLP